MQKTSLEVLSNSICQLESTSLIKLNNAIVDTLVVIISSSLYTKFLEVEFPITLMFVAWPLGLLHSFLTGLSLFISVSLHITSGFGFSAGLMGYVLIFNNPLANNLGLL